MVIPLPIVFRLIAGIGNRKMEGQKMLELLKLGFEPRNPEL